MIGNDTGALQPKISQQISSIAELRTVVYVRITGAEEQGNLAFPSFCVGAHVLSNLLCVQRSESVTAFM